MDDSRSRHGQRSDDTVHNGEPAASSLRVQELVAAIMAPSSDLDLQSVLQRIVDTAKSMVDAGYAALGVLDASGAALSDFVYVGIDPESADRIGQLPQGRGILGELVRNPRTLRLDDLTTDPNSCGFPPGHPPMHSFLGVPILIDGREYGNLYLTDKAGGASFTIEDETVVVLLAGAAGAAIRNARQYERMLRHARWLEATTAITSRLLTAAPTADVLDEIARVAHQLVGADECGVRLADSANEVLTLTAAAGVRSEDAVGEQLPIEGTFLGGVHRTGTTASAPDLGEIAPDDVLVATRGVGPILAVPLVAPQRVLGTLSLSRYRGRPSFEPWDLDLIESFAGQAALALAFNETQTLHEQMTLSDDRERIARDLHDLVIQRVFAAGLTLQATAGMLDAGAARDRIGEVVEELDATISELRTTIFAIQQHADGSSSLRLRITELVRRWGDQLGFNPRLRIAGEIDTRVGDAVAEHLLAALQEALSNVVRHARATQLSITIDVGVELRLEAEDDGVGLSETPDHRGGLSNLEDRARNLGGSAATARSELGGTRLTWTVPLGGSVDAEST